MLATSQSRIVGYLPDYRISAIDDSVGKYLSDLIFFSLEPTSGGKLDDSRFTSAFGNKLIRIKNEYGIRIHLALGGWGRSSGFAAMAGNDSLRADFIAELIDFCVANEFDGIDYDWEFPANQNEVNAYTNLIVETKNAVGPYNLIVTSALNIYQDLNPAAYQALDHIYVMSYDHDGAHATYEQAVSDIIVFLNRGILPAKLYLGVPFYGRHITNRTAYTYAEIIAAYHPSPEIDQVDGIYFNGIETIKKKTKYAIDTAIGGIMIWEVGQDTGDSTSLLAAVSQTFAEMSGIAGNLEKSAGKYLLNQNYPNPFNLSTTIEFQIPNSEFVTLKIYNMLGQEVKTLISERYAQGFYTFHADGTNLASGVYYYELVAGDFRKVKKMILLR